MPPSTLADLLVRHLRAAGVRMLFGVPGGGSNLDLIEAAHRGGLPFVLTHTETAGALMACAQAEITGQAAACLCTLGPGTSSIVNGVAHAALDRIPLIVFTDRHPEEVDVCLHQRLDHQALLAPLTKYSTPLRPETAAVALREGLARARTHPFGPVHFDCAPDALSQTIADEDVDSPRPSADPVACSAAVAERIAQAARPLVIAGLGAATVEGARAIRSFCERYAIPAMVTYKAKGVMPDTSPLFAGVFTNGAIERPVLEWSDLFLGVGLDPVELLPRPWTHRQPIVACGAARSDQGHVPFVAEIPGAVPEAVQVLAGLRAAPAQWDLDALKRAVEDQRRSLRIDAARLSPSRAITIAAHAAGPTARVAVDAGAHMVPAVGLWPVAEARQLLISNGLSTMGFALPAAIGASLLDPDRLTLALTGDGGLLMCAGELKTAVREQARVVTIVLNDASLSLIKIKQDRRGFAPAGVSLGEVDWCAVAAGMGMPAWRADDAGMLEQALKAAIETAGPALVDVRVDPATYPATLAAVRG